MDYLDFTIAPLYLIFVFMFIALIKPSATDKLTRTYYMRAFTTKVIGAVGFGLIYTYYYGGGDTLDFFYLGNQIKRTSNVSWLLTFKIISNGIVQDPEIVRYVGHITAFAKEDDPTYFVTRMAAIASIIGFGIYTNMAVWFATVSFMGSWCLFLVSSHLYPALTKKFFWAIFYIPSVIFWGSGLMKDSLTFGAAGMLFYGFYFGIIRRERIIKAVGFAIIGFLLLYWIKLYILATLILAFAIWLYAQFGKNIKSPLLKVALLPAIGLVIGVGAYYGVNKVTQGTSYDLDNLAYKTQVTSEYLRRISTAGGSYDLGTIEYTPTGLLRVFPQALVVTLFRPFLWEAGFNPVRLLSALEAAFFLFFTGYIFYKSGFTNVFNTVRSHPFVFTCLFFTVIFSFGVGIATSNFGTLVRYKIPMMPFYIMALTIILEKSPARQKKSRKRRKTLIKTLPDSAKI